MTATARNERREAWADLGLVVGDGVVAQVHVAGETMSHGAPAGQTARDFEWAERHIRRRPSLPLVHAVAIDPIAGDSTDREQRLATALAERYRVIREIGAGGWPPSTSPRTCGTTGRSR